MSAQVEFLKLYLNPVFVETGTYLGQTIKNAGLAGFQNIISIEVSKILYDKVSLSYTKNDIIHIYHGDSSKILWSVIEKIQERITFFLDAHNLEFGGDTKKLIKEGARNWPLAYELKIIANHPIKNHTIIIDDYKLFELFGMTMPQVKLLLYQINPKYNIRLTENMIVAKVNK